MYQKNVLTIPTHADIFGAPAQTEAQVIDGLKEFSSLAVFYLCTKLMLFLGSDEARSPKKQTELALGLLSQEVRERLQAYIETAEKEDPNILIFHHAPVMMMIKLNLEHNDPDGIEIVDEESHAKFASLLMSLSDIWTYNDRIKGGHGDKVQRRRFLEDFRAYQARQALQENDTEPVINLLTRGRYLMDIVRADKRMDFDGIFKAATGLELELYLDILLMLLAQWTINVDTTKLDEESVRSVDQYFKHTTLSVDDIDKFLDIVGFNIDDYQAIHRTDLALIGMPDDDSLTNFITFMKRPILRYEDKFLCISPNFLLLQLTDGPYNIVREAIKGDKKAERLLPDLWGNAYEDYVLERLEAAFGDRLHKNIPDKKGHESIDALVDLDDVALLVEIKYPHWSFKARLTGRKPDMHGFMERIARYNPKKEVLGEPKVDKKKGLGQIKYFIERTKTGEIIPPIDLNNKLLVPILILGEEYPFDPINREFLESYAGTEGCNISGDSRVLPFILLFSEEVELIESLIEGTNLKDTKKLLMTYVVRFDPKTRPAEYVNRATSFKNEVFNRGIKVPNSQLMKDRSKQAFDPVRRHFKSHVENLPTS